MGNMRWKRANIFFLAVGPSIHPFIHLSWQCGIQSLALSTGVLFIVVVSNIAVGWTCVENRIWTNRAGSRILCLDMNRVPRLFLTSTQVPNCNDQRRPLPETRSTIYFPPPPPISPGSIRWGPLFVGGMRCESVFAFWPSCFMHQYILEVILYVSR